MFKATAYYLNVIHLPTSLPEMKGDVKTEFLFGSEDGTDENRKKNGIRFRLTSRFHKDGKDLFSYVAEQVLAVSIVIDKPKNVTLF